MSELENNNPSSGSYLTGSELADYVVCPEAWRLKYLVKAKREEAPRSYEGKQQRKQWVERQDLSRSLRRYAKIVYALLVLLVAVVFFWEHKRLEFGVLLTTPTGDSSLLEAEGSSLHPGHQLRSIPRNIDGSYNLRFQEICLLLTMLGFVIFVWDLLDRRSKAIVRSEGLGEKTQLIAMHGSTFLPSKALTSSVLKLSSKPDAIVRENGFVIPVDFHPMTNVVKDRHIVQLLMHLRLIEEDEKRVSPHGILIMGNKRRLVRVKNTVEKQRWLQTLIEEMGSIRDGVPAVPSPNFAKCRGCDVRSICNFSAYS